MLCGGSKKTEGVVRQHKKPWIHLHQGMKAPAKVLQRFLFEQKIKILNVAGSRSSIEPEIAAFVDRVLTQMLHDLPD